MEIKETENSYINLSGLQIIFMATSIGIIVANMFYIQPIEPMITQSFGVSASTTSILGMLAQASYALGLLFLVPLGDLFNRYYLLQIMELISSLALLLAFISPNVYLFGITTFIIGLTSIGGQIVIPYAAYLTPIDKQGPLLGSLVSGMLTGILFARTFSGIIAASLGWHAVYGVAAVLNILLLIFMHYLIPQDPRIKHAANNYGEIISSLPKLFKKYRYLRGSALNAFALFGIANLFWGTLSFLLEKYYGFGSEVAGSMGLLGVVSIFAAPFIGKMVDKYSPKTNIRISWLLGAISFIIFSIFIKNIWMLMIGIIILDLSTQFSQVTNQAIIQSLSRKENSRNNSIFMFSYFIGGSIGTMIGINAWSIFGWSGVAGAAAIFLLIALIGYKTLGTPDELE